LLIAVAFVSAFLLTLLATAPASLLDSRVQSATQGRLALAGATGTIWSGTATPALRPQAGSAVVLPPLHWDAARLPLLTGALEVRLQWASQPAVPGMDVIITSGQVELRSAQLRLPARVIEEAAPMLKPAQFRGQLEIHSEKLAYSQRGVEGTATISWKRAGSALSSVDPLGDYRLALKGEGGMVRIALATHSGKLLLDGQGNWSPGRGLEFRGRAQAAPGNREALAELLRNLGPEESPGVHGFSIVPGR
jgi:general secretion pathway protein N